jgi:phosphoribosylformylglycinamidine synthase subunit PurQ / glutaminase
MKGRVAVLRFPGSNCEDESLRAVERVGLEGRIVRWNEPAAVLADFAAYVLPGGFSYQDRIRAGAVAARLPLLEVLARRAASGSPIFGICNGAQILVEAGLVPGPSSDGAAAGVRLSLAPNRMTGRTGYYTRWVFLAAGPSADRCLFTKGLREAVPLPIAHAEGRFATIDPELRASLAERVPLRYADAAGNPTTSFPQNPNGSLEGAAGVSNREGNVLALMPHPERAQILGSVPEDLAGPWGVRRREAERRASRLDEDGPGLCFFRAMADFLGGGV